jgi:hypothetical protein
MHCGEDSLWARKLQHMSMRIYHGSVAKRSPAPEGDALAEGDYFGFARESISVANDGPSPHTRWDKHSAASDGAPRPPITGESDRYGPPLSSVKGGRESVPDGLRSYVNTYAPPPGPLKGEGMSVRGRKAQ